MMKMLITAVLAVATLAAASSADAQPWRHHRHWGHHHRVCTWRHGHRVCFVR
jgi:opacity protein-like surface antigen